MNESRVAIFSGTIGPVLEKETGCKLIGYSAPKDWFRGKEDGQQIEKRPTGALGILENGEQHDLARISRWIRKTEKQTIDDQLASWLRYNGLAKVKLEVVDGVHRISETNDPFIAPDDKPYAADEEGMNDVEPENANLEE